MHTNNHYYHSFISMLISINVDVNIFFHKLKKPYMRTDVLQTGDMLFMLTWKLNRFFFISHFIICLSALAFIQWLAVLASDAQAEEEREKKPRPWMDPDLNRKFIKSEIVIRMECLSMKKINDGAKWRKRWTHMNCNQ